MTYGELPKHPKPGVILYCPYCESTYSAYKGDYFTREPHESIVCDNEIEPGQSCGESLYLVQRQHAPQRMIAPADAGRAVLRSSAHG